ncbi:MAG: hypothetical protein JWL61_3178 [Gemmatimonadetes bacterium]|nr:hypothetical protein [Gemmatimonadota bacterium]
MRSTVLRKAAFTAVVVLFANGAIQPLVAQVSALARVDHYMPGAFPYPIDCVDGMHTSTASISATTSCSLQMNPGTGTATALANAALRQVDAHATLAATGIATYEPGAVGYAEMVAQISWIGLAVPTNVLFTYAISHSEGATGTFSAAGSTQLMVQASNLAAGGYEFVNWSGSVGGITGFASSAGAWTNGSLATFMMPWDITGGPLRYTTSAQADAGIHRDDASTFANLGSILTGIDAYDANGQMIGSATFDSFGNAVVGPSVVPVTPTPEPASMLLLGSGLVGLVPLIRRRK